jgi:hypothetical protein
MQPLRPLARVVALAAATLLLPARVAHADDSAAQHLVVARRALTVHDYPTAITHFQQSYERDGSPLTLIFLARAYEGEGDLLSALELYRSYLEQVPIGRRAYDVESDITRLSERLLAQRIAIFDDDATADSDIAIFDDDAAR